MALTEVDNGCNGEDGVGEPEVITKTSVLGGFGESAETRALIASLPEAYGDMVSRESCTEKFLGKSSRLTDYT